MGIRIVIIRCDGWFEVFRFGGAFHHNSKIMSVSFDFLAATAGHSITLFSF